MSKSVQGPAGGEISRRDFLRISSACSLTASPVLASSAGEPHSRGALARGPVNGRAIKTSTIRGYLRSVTCSRKEIETFLDPKQPNWAKFDPELGYTLRTNVLKDGMDGCRTVETFVKTGERLTINGAQKPCRMNAYGNSFTLCQETSDGETWEEYLAAHLGEPIRNFGIGGYGAYQAFLRMKREEATPSGAEYLLLTIWDLDDYLRSIDAWRWIRFGPWWRTQPGHLNMFHGNPWNYIRLDLQSGEPIEIENSFRTRESLFKLCDPDFVYDHFKDDLVVQLVAAENGATDINRSELKQVAEALNVRPSFDSVEATGRTAHAVHTEYALRVGIRVIEKTLAYAEAQGKKLMVLLSFGAESVTAACEGRPRFDQNVVNFLTAKRIPFADALAKHAEDFRNFKISPREYADRFYVGHYNPKGNHFFAFAVKDAIVNWLDPKPLAYRKGSETIPAVI
jgi:hypothetical protein